MNWAMSVQVLAGGPSVKTPKGLLVLSDVHLGSDIGDSAVPAPARSRQVDEDLCALLAHYREGATDGEPWQLVINGDFVDFIGISLDASRVDVHTEPTAEERAHGLGTAEDHACIKLARVAERHRSVFQALAAFVDAGHELVIVAGNHDREFHWERVREDCRALLLEASGGPQRSREDAAAFTGRVRFSSWFFWLEGVAYVEHGHQYDTFCAVEHVMAPVFPPDPRRLSPDFSEVLLRYVVHATEGIRDCDHDRMGVRDYVAFALRLGFKGGAALFRRYVRAIARLFRLRRVSLGQAARAVRLEQERRLSRLAEATLIDLQRLRALVALQARPVTRSIRGILSSLLLDEIVLGLCSVGLLAILCLLSFLAHPGFAAMAGLVPVAWWVVHRYLKGTRHVDPQNELAARAASLARLFPAAFVVMGHTHVPVRTTVADGGATYVNTGSWSEEEGALPEASYAHRAARTHLVIRVRETGPEAELLAWGPTGPARFTSASKG